MNFYPLSAAGWQTDKGCSTEGPEWLRMMRLMRRRNRFVLARSLRALWCMYFLSDFASKDWRIIKKEGMKEEEDIDLSFSGVIGQDEKTFYFGKWKIDPTEVFLTTQHSYAFVNLKPVVPGMKWHLLWSEIACGKCSIVHMLKKLSWCRSYPFYQQQFLLRSDLFSTEAGKLFVCLVKQVRVLQPFNLV